MWHYDSPALIKTPRPLAIPRYPDRKGPMCSETQGYPLPLSRFQGQFAVQHLPCAHPPPVVKENQRRLLHGATGMGTGLAPFPPLIGKDCGGFSGGAMRWRKASNRALNWQSYLFSNLRLTPNSGDLGGLQEFYASEVFLHMLPVCLVPAGKLGPHPHRRGHPGHCPAQPLCLCRSVDRCRADPIGIHDDQENPAWCSATNAVRRASRATSSGGRSQYWGRKISTENFPV